MKSIIFTTDPNSELVKKLKGQGDIIVIGDKQKAIKTLKAMKTIEAKDNYQVIADEESSRYLNIAKQLGYNEYKEIKIKPKPFVFGESLEAINLGYQMKLEDETEKLKTEFDEEYKKKTEQLDREYSEKLKGLDKEISHMKNIKQAIKKNLYG